MFQMTLECLILLHIYSEFSVGNWNIVILFCLCCCKPGGSGPWNIKKKNCFSVFIYMSAGCVSTFRTCVQVYLEIYLLSSCFLPSFHVL